MFRPRTSQISREDFLEADADLVIGDTGVQGVRQDALRLLPTTGAPTPQEFTWPVVTWSREDELRSFPGEIDNGWDANFNNLAITTPQLFEFDLASGFLDIATALGEHQYVYQRLGGTPGKRYWSDNVDNALGWTLQMRVQVVSDDTGIAVGHQIVIDDGVHREVMTLRKNGILFQTNPGLDIAADLTYPREIRIGGRQDDIYVLLDNGQGIAGPNCFTGDTSIKELGFGIPTDSSGDLRTLFDYVHQYHGGVWIDERPNVLKTYSTIGSTAVTPAYAPRAKVRRFDEALVETSGDLIGGDTTVIAEYRSSLTADLWVQLSSTLITTIGIQRISLIGITAAGDGTDEVRFKVEQVSADGSAEPPTVESITVLTSFVEAGFRITPRWGPTIGGSQHVLEILPGAEDAQLLAGDDSGLTFHAPLDTTFVDRVGNITGSPTGTTSFEDDGYDGAAQLGSLGASSSVLDTALASFVDAIPFGKIGTGLEVLWSAGLLTLAQGTISRIEGGQVVSRTAQVVTAAAGNGVKVSSFASPGVVKILLQVSEGEVEILFNGISRVFDIHDYWTPRPIAISLSGTHDLEIKAKNANASFAFAVLESNTLSTGSVAFTSPGQPAGALSVDMFVKPLTLAQGSFGTRRSGNNGWELGITAEGYPYATIGDGSSSESLTGSVPVKVDSWQNLMFCHGAFSDHTGLRLYLDGQLVGDALSSLASVSAGTNLTLGGIPGLYDQVRIRDGAVDGLVFGVENGLANPIFQTAYGAPRDAYNKLVLRFATTKGVFADDSGRGHHAYLIHEWRAGLHRNQQVDGLPATLFWFNGAIGVLHTPDMTQTLPIGIYARGFFRSVDHVQELASKWNAGGTIGWKVEILADGTVKVTVKDGSTHTLTSSAVLADDSVKSLHVQISSTGIVLRIGEVEETLVEAISPIAAADQDMVIGQNLVAYLVEFALRQGTLSYADYLTWFDGETATWAPSDDQVIIDGTGVPNAYVRHHSPTRKYMVLPAHVQGNVPIFVQCIGATLNSERQFIYALTYKRPIDQAKLEKVPKIHSPFRIVPTVKRGGVNLALVQMPDISVEGHVSMNNLSYLAGENLSTYFGGIFPVVGPETGVGVLSYAGQVDTDDLRVSNRSVMRRDVKEPTPLFYRYLIGRGRRYVYQPSATTVSDVGLIRQGIEIIDGDGQKLDFAKFPWDIEVSDKDTRGRQLPDNVFAVTLFTAQPYLASTSVQVRFTAADILYGFRLHPNFTEYVNPEPAMGRVDGVPGYDQFALELESGGTYKISVGTTGL
jgi:hypothetical protein